MTDLGDLGEEEFVSLTTYRRSGEPVAVPVWVARHDSALVVTTPPGSGKVKRLRRDPRVTLRPCSRRGKVAPDAPTATGRAEIVADPDAVTAASRAIADKYGFQYRLVMLAERVLRRERRPDRVILRLTPDA